MKHADQLLSFIMKKIICSEDNLLLVSALTHKSKTTSVNEEIFPLKSAFLITI
jgi:hypothetical protein